ncbi:MAG: DNA-directed RNA polymerase subunit omega [Candidatus Omnitrophica bacterium]|nr:DNA-directed RNA polymerase subunit omega [Candidatus Omnitrophota bacterium]
MPYVPIEKLLKHQSEPSLFRTVLTAAVRANQLAQGAQPLVKTDSKKVATIALEEVADGKVNYVEEKTKGKKASS